MSRLTWWVSQTYQARLATLLSRLLIGECRRLVEIRSLAPEDEATG